jgi:Zn-dependent alcohol dehydrogenase
MALGPTQPPIRWVQGALSLGVKRSVCEADHSPPSSAEVKECVELYFHSPNTPSWRGAQFRKHMDNCTFTFFRVMSGVNLICIEVKVKLSLCLNIGCGRETGDSLPHLVCTMP